MVRDNLERLLAIPKSSMRRLSSCGLFHQKVVGVVKNKLFLSVSILSVLILGVLIFVEGTIQTVILLYLSIMVSIVFLLGVAIYFKDRLHYSVVLIVGVLGILNAFIMPVLNSPDEQAHFARSLTTADGNLMFFPSSAPILTTKSFYHIHDFFGKPFVETDLIISSIDQGQERLSTSADSNLFIGYLPQALGVLTAKALQLPEIWLLWLSRLFNLAAYCVLAFLSVKIAPDFKYAIFFVAAMPMSIQQASSASYDMLINGGSLLLISYFLFLYYEKSPPIKFWNLAPFFALALLVGVMKITLVFLVLLILLVPRMRFTFHFALTVRVFFSIFVVAIIILNFMRMNGFPVVNIDYLTENHVSASEQIAFLLSEPINGTKIILSNMLRNIPVYWEQLYTFGWLSYSSLPITAISLFVFAALCFRKTKIRFSLFRKVFIFLIVIGIYGATLLALYLAWTTVASPQIVGVQGRYFISLLLLLPLILSAFSKTRSEYLYSDDPSLHLRGTSLYIQSLSSIQRINVAISIFAICCIGSYLVITMLRYF